MEKVVQVCINSEAIEKIIEHQLQHVFQQYDGKQVFWDIKTLCKKTCMSRSFVQSTFFWLPDFPKFKVGGKWLVRAEEAEKYLIEWSKKQSKL